MPYLRRVALFLAVVLGCSSAALAAPRCGDAPNDRATVAALETSVAAQCDCCGPPQTNARCVVGAVKVAMRAGKLSRMCARKLLRDTIRVCPLTPSGLPCHVCNGDDECAVGEFCECRTASCTKSGGICVPRPDVCPEIAAPVCGCDGMTYGNDCERQAAGACKLHSGSCVQEGGCFETIGGQCTGEACSPQAPCKVPNEFCSPKCVAPPPQGTCFDLRTRSCTNRTCGAGTDCLPKEACLPSCPPPLPTGKCFVTVDNACSDEPCGPDQPCTQPNEFCSPACLGSPDRCTSDADCDDGNGCSADQCVNGTCAHACLCVSPQGTANCCPGPAAFCVKPCGGDAAGVCGGSCPKGAGCMSVPDASTCGCVSQLGGPCGGNLFAPPLVCAPGLVCKQENPDATGVCVEPTGPCGSVDACGGACPVVCADGTTATGQCLVVVVDPPGPNGGPVGPTCRCFGDCPAPPTPTPRPGHCGDGPQCGGPCSRTCADGSTVTGQCVPPPFGATEPHHGACACIASCGPPPPTPTPGPCGSVDACGGACPVACADGSTATGKCAVVVVDPPGMNGEPVGPTCRCFGDCPAPPTPTPRPGQCGDGPQCGGPCSRVCDDGSTVTGQCVPPPFASADPHRGCACIAHCGPPPPPPTPGPCDPSSGCSGTCPFTCPDGTAMTGKCLGLPHGMASPMHGSCGCFADCGQPPPTVPPPPHGTICCQCGDPPNKCGDIHWVEVTPICPDGCKTVVNGSCDSSTNSCVAPTPCQADSDCGDDNGCTSDRCDDGVCVHECLCEGPAGSCHPGPGVQPNFLRTQ